MKALRRGLMVISCLLAMEISIPTSRAAEVPQAKPEAPVPHEKSIYGPIQRREYELGHEISLGWAYLPLDPYSKGYGVQLAYTIHFNHLLALELFRVGWSYNVDTSLKTKLIDQMPDISPSEFPSVIFFENTNLLLKLLYGKHTFINRTVLHFEVFATAGGAFLVRSPYNVFDMDANKLTFDFGVNGGFGFRIWLDPNWSVRVDLRDTVIFLTINKGEFPFKNSALVGLSFSVNL
jgi:outer membrane beta-barrel protein